MVGSSLSLSQSATSELDELIEQWTHDRTAVRDRTLELIRVAHIVMGPLVVAGLFVAVPDRTLVIAGIVYLAGMASVLLVLPRRWQATALGVFDLLLIGHVSASDPAMWTALLVPAVAAMTVGWLVSPRATWVLWAALCGGMGAAAYVAGVPGWLYTVLVMAGSTAGLNFNNLKILGEGRDSVLRVADLVDSLPVIVWEADVDTFDLIRAVGRVEELLGFSPADWRAMSVSRRVHHADLDEYRLDPATMNEAEVREVRLRRFDGTLLRVREVVRQVEVGDRRYFRGVILDIAEEAAVREQVDRLAAVVANQSEPLLVVSGRDAVDAEPEVLQMNPAFAALAGIDADDGLGRRLADVAPWLPATVRADLDDQLLSGRVADRDDVEIVTPTGSRTFDYELVALPDGAVGVQFADVTDRKHATELIRHQAFHDPLTALPNRSLLFDRLAHALAGMRRDRTTVGLLLLDLNQFKEINDTLGHGFGDELLTTIGVRLSEMMRDGDTVARLGGDEFAIVLNGADEADLQEISQRVADAIKQPVRLDGIELEVTASIGGSVAPTHGRDAHILLQRADIAMYDAKRSGLPYRLYVADDDRHSLDRLTLMGELRHLLEDGLRVWFQPKVDLRTGRVQEMEALARWQHSRLGLVGPGQFIELCEVSGLISELTFAVLERSLEVIADWPGQRVAVNVPVRNLYDRHLPDAVAERLAAAGVSSDRLILEITEREIMEDHRAIVDVLEALHEMGVRISIDDFGTGFSSLTHLRRLPVQEIKIDQSFISGMLDRENDYIIARSIIDLAHNLGHSVVAEGVEDTATLALLRSLGCDVAQGFLFARPGPPERIRRQIEAGPALDDHGTLVWNRPD
ncbi:MAG: EAL domain-containing protein [Acidimicrobiales bacterium]|nr:EAL domain-containing protein [Acidimicrobiales bacterium]